MAERICLMSFYPTKCKDDCFNCDCGGQEATKDMYVSINNVQRVCAIQGNAADTDEGEYIAEVIRNNLETMATDVSDIDMWISIKERPPLTAGVYNVVYGTDEGTFTTSCYFDGTDTWYHDVGINHDKVATDKVMMWQPLPELPKDGVPV